MGVAINYVKSIRAALPSVSSHILEIGAYSFFALAICVALIGVVVNQGPASDESIALAVAECPALLNVVLASEKTISTGMLASQIEIKCAVNKTLDSQKNAAMSATAK